MAQGSEPTHLEAQLGELAWITGNLFLASKKILCCPPDDRARLIAAMFRTIDGFSVGEDEGE